MPGARWSVAERRAGLGAAPLLSLRITCQQQQRPGQGQGGGLVSGDDEELHVVQQFLGRHAPAGLGILGLEHVVEQVVGSPGCTPRYRAPSLLDGVRDHGVHGSDRSLAQNGSRSRPLASVTINESDLSAISPLFFIGGLADVGVHNLFLFTQDSEDFVAAVSGGAFDNFRIYKITDPTAPVLVSGWGAEEIFDPGVGDLTLANDPTGSRTLAAILDLFDGFGSSQNKFLHDITINEDGDRAYLSNWDAGLVLLDISDVSDPQVVSVALDLDADGDMEVNSHAAWPSEDGSVVVEGNEDFAPFELTFTIDDGPNAGEYPAAEGAITIPIASLPGDTMTGPAAERPPRLAWRSRPTRMVECRRLGSLYDHCTKWKGGRSTKLLRSNEAAIVKYSGPDTGKHCGVAPISSTQISPMPPVPRCSGNPDS